MTTLDNALGGLSKPDRQCWKTATVYQIYPASFKDSNGDGFGDLQGILGKLDYLKELGVDALWISPFYESPNYDMGYDISDYQKPDPRYGKLSDIEAIIKGCHERGLKILFDLVINHTSHLHRWFKESESSKDNKYRDYYFWQPPRYDEEGNRIPPTNWKSLFGGSAWQYSEKTGEYYLHYFAPEQPDLNWESEEVRDVIFKAAILFWLEKGVDGFRIDTSGMYSKQLPFKDVKVRDPHNFIQPSGEIYDHGPRLDEFLVEMYTKTFEKYGLVTIAEMGGDTTTERMLKYVSTKEKKYAMAIRFDLVKEDHDFVHYLYEKKMPLSVMKEVNRHCQEIANPEHDAWLCNYLENHDQARCVSRFADDSPQYRQISARMLAIHIATLSGTLLLYEGQEIGMINMPKDWGIEEYPDTLTIGYWEEVQKAIKDGVEGYNLEDAWKGAQKLARDHARTPMQWSSEKNGGFTTGDKPWMRVMDSYKEINVADQETDKDSVLNFWRQILKLRKEHAETFIFGEFQLLDPKNEKTFCYIKQSHASKEAIFVALNFTGESQPLVLPVSLEGVPELLASASTKSHEMKDDLEPWEGRIYLYK